MAVGALTRCVHRTGSPRGHCHITWRQKQARDSWMISGTLVRHLTAEQRLGRFRVPLRRNDVLANVAACSVHAKHDHRCADIR
jgi:hypothetical protein